MTSNQPFRLALTGSVGMGKTTTARMFAEVGVPVWDADAAVHRLYDRGGAGTAAIAGIAPEAVQEGRVDRDRLRHLVQDQPGLLARIEAAIHPLVRADRAVFSDSAKGDLVLFDIPLLFETHSEAEFDAIIVVTAPPEVQRARVLARPGMTEASLDMILSRQMPDAEKRSRADYIIDTSRGLVAVQKDVQTIVQTIRRGHHA